MRAKLTKERVIAYLAGLLLLAFGIGASVRSDLGSSPVSSVPYMFRLISGLDLGITTILWQSFLVLLQVLILRRDFRPIQLLQLVTGFLFGYFNTFAGWFYGLFPAPRSLVVRALFTCIGFVVGGLGVWLYSSADVMNLPSEGIVLVVAEKVRQPFHRMKIAFDVSSVLLAGSVCLAVLRTLGSVGVGTVVIAILLGMMVGVYTRVWGAGLKRWLAREKKAPAPLD